MNRIAFIGGGNMAYALAGSFFRGDSSVRISVCDPDEKRGRLFRETLGENVTLFEDFNMMAENADLLILAVKPQVLPEVAEKLRVGNCTVLSIAAGISLTALEKFFPGVPLVRLMPNTPCLVGEMAGGVVFSPSVTENQKNEIMRLLSMAGSVVEVEESLMDGVTGLSGSGPAFVARLIEAFIKAGVRTGLSEEQSRFLTLATFSGTAKLLAEKKMTPEELVIMVSSPKGTTVAGREKLEASDYAEIISETVIAAAERSRELGNGRK